MRDVNWATVKEAAEFPKPEPGGYIIRIVRVEDNEAREYLRIEYDFAEGDLKNYYKDLYAARDFWGGVLIRSYKEKALPFFKAFKTSVEASNSGYTFRNDPKTLVGKFLGVVLGEEEYRSNAGEVKTRLYVAQVRSGQAIRSGDYTVPPLKKLAEETNTGGNGDFSGFYDLVDDDGEIPF